MGLLPLFIGGNATGISDICTIFTSLPSKSREFASPPELQSEVVMYPISQPSLYIHLYFAG